MNLTQNFAQFSDGCADRRLDRPLDRDEDHDGVQSIQMFFGNVVGET